MEEYLAMWSHFSLVSVLVCGGWSGGGRCVILLLLLCLILFCILYNYCEPSCGSLSDCKKAG